MAGSGGREAARQRLLAAVAKAAGEEGSEKVTAERVARYAGLPREAFEECFESTEQALLAAYDSFLERLLSDAAAACRARESWPDGVRAAIGAILSSLVEASSLARALLVETSTGTLAGAEREMAAVDRFAALLRAGRRAEPAAAELPEVTERALVGGLTSIVHGCLLNEDPHALSLLEPQLVELILIPYVGGAEAKRAAAR